MIVMRVCLATCCGLGQSALRWPGISAQPPQPKAVWGGRMGGNLNHAVKSSLLLSFLEPVPDVAVKHKGPKSLQAATPPFEEVVKSAQEAAVLVLVY